MTAQRRLTGLLLCFFALPVRAAEEQIKILPEEAAAQSAAGEGIGQGFRLLEELPADQKSRLNAQFEDGAHWIQNSLASVRFFHALNQSLRHRDNPGDSGAMTSAQAIQGLDEWTKHYRQHIKTLGYPPEYQAVMTNFLASWDIMLALTRKYPDQDQYDQAKQGLIIIESVLSKARKNPRHSTPKQ